MKLLFAFALSFFISTASALETITEETGDYCLGEWPDSTQAYCDNLMMYVRTVAIDRNVGRDKDEVLAEIPEAVMTYIMPEVLAENYIHFIYQHEPNEYQPQEYEYHLFGGCIDRAVMLQNEGRADAIRLNTQRFTSE